MKKYTIIQRYNPNIGYWYVIRKRVLFFFSIILPLCYSSQAQAKKAIQLNYCEEDFTEIFLHNA